MDSSLLGGHLSIENIRQVLQGYHSFGPLLGISLPLLESFLPFLLLLLFVAANAAVCGFWLGAFLSWFGTCLGAMTVFVFFRMLAKGRFKRWIEKSSKVSRTLKWVERHGFGPLFLLHCIPFTPSSLVNVASGLLKLSSRSFLISVLLGKMVMIFMVSYVGYDWMNMIHEPLKMLFITGIVIVLWLAGKRMEMRMVHTEKQKQKERKDTETAFRVFCKKKGLSQK